jgi:aminopeptidase
MRDPRLDRLAALLVGHSLELKPGQRVYVELRGAETFEFGKAIIEAVAKAGGVPLWHFNDDEFINAFACNATSPAQFESWGELHRTMMDSVEAYIGVRGNRNPYEAQAIPADNEKLFRKAYWERVHSLRIESKRWVVLRYPSNGLAVMAGMSCQEFEDLYFNACLMDLGAMSLAMDPLVRRMEAADRVQITGPGTDLSFSIKGMKAVKCDGHRNVPDGEVYTAPIIDSMNGQVTYNIPSVYSGHRFEWVRFVVKDGLITQWDSDRGPAQVGELLATDEGARRFGEFSFGLNRMIKKPVLDTLFDEKIGGSFHLTPGNAYKSADNGNRSALHWDLVCLQDAAHGGGQILFDGQVIRQDGFFVPEDLQALDRL